MRAPAMVLLGAVCAAAVCAGESAYAGEDAVIGTGIGAAVGGLFGSQIGRGSGQIVSTTLGIALGGTIGNAVGQDMDREERSRQTGAYTPSPEYAPIIYYSYTPNYVAPPAPPPQTAAPITYVDQNGGEYCRPYSQEIRIDGEVQETYGTACLQPDGTWKIVQ